MVRPIMKDVLFLNQASEPATKADLPVVQDLLETLKAHEADCVGMAANMIGVKKSIIAINMQIMLVAMINPKIVKQSGPYETEEACLSLTGMRQTTRYQDIEIEYYDINFKKQRGHYSGWTAQIIQHEILPDPPESIEQGPTSPAPSDEHFWIPGVWKQNQQQK